MRIAQCGVLVALLSLSAVAPAVRAPEAADLVLHNGAIYRVDAARSWASAVAVDGNKIVYVGLDAGVEPFVGPDTRVIDLDGRVIFERDAASL